MAEHADVVLITDPRFMGGTASSLLADVTAFLEADLKVAVVFFRADRFFRAEDTDNPQLTALAEDPRLIPHPQSAEAVFLHNPQIFGPHQIKDLRSRIRQLRCEKLFMVAHHPPFLGNGALSYDPLSISHTAKQAFDKPICWLPVSGLVRKQLRSFQPFLQLSPVNWVNSFATEDWPMRTPKFDADALVIGRHGRPHPEKWPDEPHDIAASLPEGPRTQVRVLGADREFFDMRGVETAGWDILPFGALTPQQFLADLDVFCYFHSANWCEAFGRTVAEAMLVGVRCVLDPALQPTFGDHAIYCRPAEVPSVLDDIRQNPQGHSAAVKKASDWCRSQFATTLIAPRFKKVLASTAKRRPDGPRSTPPVVTLRKLIGLHRRSKEYIQP